MQYVMAIDVGTKDIKTIIYRLDGKLLSHSAVKYSIVYSAEITHPEWASLDPHVLWEKTVQSIKKALCALQDPSEILAVCVTGIGMDGLPLNKKGEPLFPIISWHCTRTEPQYQRFTKETGKEKIFAISGRQALSIDSIYRIMWFKENAPELYRQTEKWLLLPDFINYKLCGEMSTDFSMASTTSLFDQSSQSWSEEMARAAGIDMRFLPRLTPSGTVLGSITELAARETGLSVKTKVVQGGHDYLCAAHALPGSENTMIDITGSWEMLIVPTTTNRLLPTLFRTGLKLDSHVEPGKYAIVGDVVSTSMLDWYRGVFLNETDTEDVWWTLLGRAEKADAGCNGVFFLPHCTGSSCPNPDTMSAGAFIGIRDFVSKEVMLRAVVEGLNYQFNDMVEAVEKALGKKASEIVAMGYDSQNSFLMQNKADITGKTIKVPATASASCFGAALLAGQGVGESFDPCQFRSCMTTGMTVYKPDPSTYKRYQNYSSIFKRIYFALKDINHDIYRTFRFGFEL